MVLSSFCYLEAKELKGLKFEDTVTIGKSILKLNGLGVRRYMIFDVYVGGLYLEKPSSDPNEIVASSSTKHIVLKFKRWVELSVFLKIKKKITNIVRI
jgi:hypothetical protein